MLYVASWIGCSLMVCMTSSDDLPVDQISARIIETQKNKTETIHRKLWHLSKGRMGLP